MSWSDTHDEGGLRKLVGQNIAAVSMTEDDLTFTTSTGRVYTYGVEGDCCSTSYFHDLVGKEKLIENGPVVSVGAVDIDDPDEDDPYEVVQAYGFEIVTEHPKWGEQTTVLSFRNSSNGYYGGWMRLSAITEADGTQLYPEVAPPRPTPVMPGPEPERLVEYVVVPRSVRVEERGPSSGALPRQPQQ